MKKRIHNIIIENWYLHVACIYLSSRSVNIFLIPATFTNNAFLCNWFLIYIFQSPYRLALPLYAVTYYGLMRILTINDHKKYARNILINCICITNFKRNVCLAGEDIGCITNIEMMLYSNKNLFLLTIVFFRMRRVTVP